MQSAAAAETTPRALGRKGGDEDPDQSSQSPASPPGTGGQPPVLLLFVTRITFLQSALASGDCEPCGYWMNLYAGGRAGKPGNVPGTQ